MRWEFTLIETFFSSRETIIDEPVGWDALSMVLQRDPDWHGINPLFSASNLQFANTAYWILKDEYERAGIDGDIGIRIRWKCDDCKTWKVFFEGKIDFGRYDEECAEDCYIIAGIEDTTAQTLLKNRQDTDVDLTSNIAYDGETELTNYTGLNKEITIPSKAILLQSEANTQNAEEDMPYNILADADYTTYGDYHTAVRTNEGVIIPKLNNTTKSELLDFTPSYAIDFVKTADKYTNTEILKVNNDSGLVVLTNYNVSLRFKGSLLFSYETTTGNSASIREQLGVSLKYGNAFTDAFTPVIFENFLEDIFDSGLHSHTIDFDFSWTGVIPLAPLEKVFPFIDLLEELTSTNAERPISGLEISFDDESFFNIDVSSIVAATPCKTFMLHEAASRIVESITNNALKFKSEYFGRTDSEPYAYDADGCGGLRTLTNGLKIRQATLTDGSDPKVFTNFKNLLNSLNAIDLIGYGIEENNVRTEPVQFFYKNIVVFVADGVNAYSKKIKTDRVWNQFSFGFEKYETESTNGLDAIHTKRQYRIPLQNTDNKIEKLCKYILDGYAIEVTRRKFGTTDDWRYDQDIFMLCLKRGDEDVEVEQGNIDSAANLFDPATVINYRLSPIHNALRWFKWVMQGLRNLGSSVQMLFSSGEGNYVAEGELDDALCRLEDGVIAEDAPLMLNSFANAEDGQPFIVPEEVMFTFPLGLNEFLFLKENIYGLVQYRRNADEDWQFGWITKLEPHHEDGDATFTLVTALGATPVDETNFIITESGLVIDAESGSGLITEN